MNHKQGTDRRQMTMFCPESSIARDSFVRVVDAFVDAIDLKSFGFDKDGDVYVCPRGQEMRTNNTWYRHSDKRKGKPGAYRFRRYNTPLCKSCESRKKCTNS